MGTGKSDFRHKVRPSLQVSKAAAKRKMKFDISDYSVFIYSSIEIKNLIEKVKLATILTSF